MPGLLQTLRGSHLLPAIIFWPTRRACDEAAAAFHEVRLPGAGERADAYHELARDYPLLEVIHCGIRSSAQASPRITPGT